MEYAGFLFDLILDQGAYFRIKNGIGMLTLIPQILLPTWVMQSQRHTIWAGEAIHSGNG